MKIKLTDWAEARYRGGVPRHTLRRWARAGEIQPQPEIVGKEYWVEETAERVDVPVPNQPTLLQRLQA